jgi:4-amino-4-deoxy-L-arabinose transferase-like glycosyltransferase
MELEEQKKLSEKKEKLKSWLKNPYNLAFLAVIIFAFAIRFHYFLLTENQPLWWDEAVFGTLAKNMVFGGRWSETFLIVHESVIRPPLLPMFWAILLKFGIGEAGVRFLLELIPSVISVFFVYLIGKELYNKKVGLIASFLFSVLWIHLFYTARLLTDVPNLAFLFISIYYFIKSQKTEFNAKNFGISVFFLSLSTLVRYQNGLFFFAYLAFFLITQKVDLLKNKKFWLAGAIGLLPLLAFFFINYINYNNIFPAFLGDEYLQAGSGNPQVPFGFSLLKFVPIYLQTPFFILFFVGLILCIFELGIGYDVIRKKHKLQAHILIFSLFAVIYSFFIFYMRTAEDRWLFPAALPMAIFVGLGAEYIHSFLKKFSKILSAVVILSILIFGAYQQVVYADSLIQNKKESFLQFRQGFEWIRFNTPEDSIISGNSIPPYATYYAERDYFEPLNISELENAKIDYFVLHVLTPPPEFMNEYIQNNQDEWQPVNVFFFDKEQTQPALIIYKRIY